MFEADDTKAIANLDKHGLPLNAAQLLFDGPFIEEEDQRNEYGESRFVATGLYTWRGAVRRIISFRKANDREIRKYQANNTR